MSDTPTPIATVDGWRVFLEEGRSSGDAIYAEHGAPGKDFHLAVINRGKLIFSNNNTLPLTVLADMLRLAGWKVSEP